MKYVLLTYYKCRCHERIPFFYSEIVETEPRQREFSGMRVSAFLCRYNLKAGYIRSNIGPTTSVRLISHQIVQYKL
jgi:hypothetical protein